MDAKLNVGDRISGRRIMEDRPYLTTHPISCTFNQCDKSISMREPKMKKKDFQELVFGEPPPRKSGSGRSGYDWNAVKDSLDSRSGEWARIRAFEDTKSAGRSSGFVRKRFGPDYEVITRGNEMWARRVSPTANGTVPFPTSKKKAAKPKKKSRKIS